MISKIEKNPVLTLAVIALGFTIFAVFTSLPKITDFIIFCIFVLGFDLIYGHMGHLTFGHMLYLGAGSYGAAMFAYFVSPNPFLAIACGIATAAVLSLILGPVVVKTSGAAFALLNLALNEVGAFMVLVPFPQWTGGEDGLSVYFERRRCGTSAAASEKPRFEFTHREIPLEHQIRMSFANDLLW